MYKLIGLHNNVLIEPIKAKDTSRYTSKLLADVDTNSMDVLQYGKVVWTMINNQVKVGDVVLYEKLASHKTNFGNPRLVLVDIEHIQGKLEEADA